MSSGCAVQFDQNANGFTLLQDANCFNAASSAAFTQSVFRPGEGSGYTVNSLPVGSSWSADNDPILFNALGQVTDAGGSVLGSTTFNAAGRTITLDGPTGYIR
jgi:hypothetical protein